MSLQPSCMCLQFAPSTTCNDKTGLLLERPGLPGGKFRIDRLAPKTPDIMAFYSFSCCSGKGARRS